MRAVPILMMNLQPKRIIKAASLTGDFAYSLNSCSEAEGYIRHPGIETAVSYGRTRSCAKAPLSTLKCCPTSNNSSTKLAWTPLDASNRAIFIFRPQRPAIALAARFAGLFWVSGTEVLKGTLSGATNFALLAVDVLASKLILTDSAFVHSI